MLLCDAALGKQAELTRDQFMTKPLPKTNSTFAMGTLRPSSEHPMELRKPKLPSNKVAESIDHVVQVPLGKPKSHKVQSSFFENQLVVYDVAQVTIRYLIHFRRKD